MSENNYNQPAAGTPQEELDGKAAAALASTKEYTDGVSAELARKAYVADVEAQDAATLAGAKAYTDTRETAVLAAADAKDTATLATAQAYADQIVAALVDNSPAALDTLKELAAALGDDPNFAATVMQLIGERATMEQVNAALAGKFGVLGNDILADDAEQGAGYCYTKGTPTHGTVATFNGLSADNPYGSFQLFCDNQESNNARFWARNNNQQGFTPWRELYHTGNFNPAATVRTEDVLAGSLNAIPFFPAREVVGLNIPNIEASAMLNMEYDSQIVQLKISDYLGRLSAHIRGNTSRVWRELYHSGNLDKAKLDALPPRIIAGSVYDDGQIRKGSGFSAALQGNYIRVTHSLGHTNYIVTATAFAAGYINHADNTVTTLTQTANYFDLSVTSIDGSIERCTIDFMLVCV